MRIVIDLPDQEVIAAFTAAAAEFGYRVDPNLDENDDFRKAIEQDLRDVMGYDLTEFFFNGLNNDGYTDFVEDDEDAADE